ncbi:MAG: TetR/AcrR family transcriptional regulator [Spirochaetota bacterium]
MKPENPLLQQILEAAKKKFSQNGYRATTIEQIAEAAATSKTMIYYHYKNKSALYEAVLKSLFALKADEYKDFALGEQKEELLYLFSKLLQKMQSDRLARYSLLAREMAERKEHFRELCDVYWLAYYQYFTNIVARGVASGEFVSKQPVEFTAFTLFADILSYQSLQVTYSGTEVYEKLYPENYYVKKMQYLEDLLEKLLKSETAVG